MRKRDDRRDQGHGVRIVLPGGDERAVDLEDLYRQLGQIAERRVAGAEVVDGDVDAQAAQGVQLLDVGVDVVHHHAFRELDVDAGRRYAAADRLFHQAHEAALPQ